MTVKGDFHILGHCTMPRLQSATMQCWRVPVAISAYVSSEWACTLKKLTFGYKHAKIISAEVFRIIKSMACKIMLKLSLRRTVDRVSR